MQKHIRRRTGDWLSRLSSPRLIMLIAFLVSFVIGFGASGVLLDVGLSNMALRFGLCFLIGYATYLSVLVIWSWRAPCVEFQALLAGAPEEAQTSAPDDSDGIEGDELFGNVLHHLNVPDEPHHLLLLGAIMVILGAVIAVVHWVRFAPWYLAEILIRGGKVRHPNLLRPMFAATVLIPVRQTMWVALALVVHSMAAGAILQYMLPQASTIAEAIQLMR